MQQIITRFPVERVVHLVFHKIGVQGTRIGGVIARADLPEILDSDRDAAALAALGLGEDDLAALLPAVSGDPLTGRRGRDELAQAVSDRWAHLVSAWTGRADG